MKSWYNSQKIWKGHKNTQTADESAEDITSSLSGRETFKELYSNFYSKLF